MSYRRGMADHDPQARNQLLARIVIVLMGVLAVAQIAAAIMNR